MVLRWFLCVSHGQGGIYVIVKLAQTDETYRHVESVVHRCQ